jgi:hypothetical protein
MHPNEEAKTPELVRQALVEARRLVQLEIALARAEVGEEVSGVKISSVYLGLAAGALLVGLALVLTGVALAIHVGWVPAFVIGWGLVVLGVAVGLVGYGQLPKKPLVATRQRIKADLERLKERTA